MRVARASPLLVAAALLVCGLQLTLALPADMAEAAEPAEPAEPVSQRDPEEQPASGSAPGYHFPRPSEIIHAVGSYVHGSLPQPVSEHVQEHVELVQQHHPELHRPTHRPPHARPPHGEKPKIKATKTVLVEFTKRVTRHPVCLAVHGVKPPCLPYLAYSAGGHTDKKPCSHGLREGEEDASSADQVAAEDIYGDDAELKEGLYISPTAVAALPLASSQILDAVEDLESVARSGRYLELRPPAPPAAPASATPALPSEQSGRQHLIAAAANAAGTHIQNGPLGQHHKPEVIVEYTTLWVTKVEKVWDHRVTATLVAENCVPTDLKIPFCGSGAYGPTYEGGDEIVYKPTHKPVHKPVHHEPAHKPVHHEPAHKPVHHEPAHKPVHHEPAHKPVHHEPVHHEPAHKPVHHEPAHKPVHHEPAHKPVHHEPAHKPVHHEPVHHEPAHKPVHHEPAHKPAYKPEVEVPGSLEYSEGPEEHHWKEDENNEALEEAAVQTPEEASSEEKPADE